MRPLRFHAILLIALALLGAGAPVVAAAAQETLTQVEADLEASQPPAPQDPNAISPYAYPLFEIGPFMVTNSMATTWVFSLLIILLFRRLAGKPTLIPNRGQAVVENMIEAIRGILEPIVGARLFPHTFPLLITLFAFILIMNWSALLPGVGTFGLVEEDHGHEHLVYFFRPAGADLNTTLALALISFGAWLYFVLRYAGVKALVLDLFGNKANKKEIPAAIYYPLFLVFFAVGLIECISIASRLLSLSFRLFGNVLGGENLLANMHGIYAYILPVPFYFLELLIGLIQAFVFTMLTAVYIGLICNHEGGEHEHDEHSGDEGREGASAPAAH